MPELPEKDLSLQNDFFNQARKSRARVTIFLSSGKRLVGRIKGFDRFTIILDAGNGSEELIFKHAIATLSISTRSFQHEPRSGEGRPRPETVPAESASLASPAPLSPASPAPASPPDTSQK